jgi:hypothetical protein
MKADLPADAGDVDAGRADHFESVRNFDSSHCAIQGRNVKWLINAAAPKGDPQQNEPAHKPGGECGNEAQTRSRHETEEPGTDAVGVGARPAPTGAAERDGFDDAVEEVRGGRRRRDGAQATRKALQRLVFRACLGGGGEAVS